MVRKEKSKVKGEVLKDVKPFWKKVTRGKLYPFPDKRNKRIKEGETVQASKEDLGKYVDQFELVKDGTGKYQVNQDEAEEKVVKVKKPVKVEDQDPEAYSVKKVKDGKFNVVSPAGKVMNDEPLSNKEALGLKESLEKESSEE